MPHVIGAVLVGLLGILMLWWARASRRGTLRRQWIFGYRTALTLRDNGAWVTANRATAPYLYIAGFGAIAASFVSGVLAFTEVDAVAPVLLGAAIGWILLWVIVAVIPAAAAARAYKRTTTDPS